MPRGKELARLTRFELVTSTFAGSRSAPLSYSRSYWSEKPGIIKLHPSSLPLRGRTSLFKSAPGRFVEPGWDALPSRLANERLKPLGRLLLVWGEPPDSNRYRPGSRPGALPLSEVRQWRRLRGSNSHVRQDITGFKPDKRANLASLHQLVWEAGFEPATSRVQAEGSGQAELLPGNVW